MKKSFYQHGHKNKKIAMKYTKMVRKYQMTQKYTEFLNPSPSKIYQNWHFWFENKPPGKPPSGDKDQVINKIHGQVISQLFLPCSSDFSKHMAKMPRRCGIVVIVST
jgi:hypothetical protein